ncbi:hypothetical protein P700755_004008 [Psychroflexus torquis ATCC 700755]|uniref:Uncharacterized protein n=1 Tax=Psychroflexus torquis (strain ATCC 700755 / CIP 106069 / ACAM 623) TaxID=313595 RepID=K4IYM2_PSYTT|nr:hypothetical protein P700755_004008 [Psychroflexus torquis ATCC 700755]
MLSEHIVQLYRNSIYSKFRLQTHKGKLSVHCLYLLAVKVSKQKNIKSKRSIALYIIGFNRRGPLLQL